MSEPERLLERNDDLGALLRSAHGDVLDAERVERVRGAVTVAVGGSAVAGAAARRALFGLKLLVPVVLTGLGAAWWVRAHEQPIEHAPVVVPGTVVSPLPTAVSPLPIEEQAPAEHAPAEQAPAVVPSEPAKAKPVVRAAVSPQPGEEGLLLLQARRSLEQDPQHALDLVRQHERQFPESQLVPERNRLRAEAIARGAK